MNHKVNSGIRTTESFGFMHAVHKRKISFAFFIVLVLLISLTDFDLDSGQALFNDLFLHLVCRLCLFLLPVYIFRNHLKTYYWLLIPVIILSSLLLYCSLFFNVRLSPEVILLAVNTSTREASELSRGSLFIYLLTLMIVLAASVWLIFRLPSTLPSRKSLIISLTSTGIFLLYPFLQKEGGGYFNRMKISAITIFPVSFLYDVGKVYRMNKRLQDNAGARNAFRFRAKQIIHPGTRQIYVLIIGESSRAGQWGINSYYRNTSPKLSKRTNLISFPNMASGGYITEYAVPQIISEATPENFDLQNREKCIVSAFKEAGFKTYWISNNLDDGSIQTHAREADETIFNIGFNPKDMNMVGNDLTKVLDTREDKLFIVLHTNGSHWFYPERYPPAFELFKPALKNFNIDFIVTPKKYKEQIINSYDNSILYSDAVIDSVIGLVARKNACSFVFYVADHGEDLLDNGKEKMFHAIARPSEFVAHVPFFLWYSDKYNELFPEKINWLKIHRDRKTGTENIFPSLAEMAALNFPSLDTTKSILNGAFQDSQQKILGGDSKVYSYESLLRE